MHESYALREPVDRTTLVQALQAAAKELDLVFTTHRPVGEPRSSRNIEVLVKKIIQSTGWRRLAAMIFPKTQFSYATLLLFEQIEHLNFLLHNCNPIEFGFGGLRSTEIGEEHPDYAAAKSSLNSYMNEVYGVLNEGHNQARHQ